MQRSFETGRASATEDVAAPHAFIASGAGLDEDLFRGRVGGDEGAVGGRDQKAERHRPDRLLHQGGRRCFQVQSGAEYHLPDPLPGSVGCM